MLRAATAEASDLARYTIYQDDTDSLFYLLTDPIELDIFNTFISSNRPFGIQQNPVNSYDLSPTLPQQLTSAGSTMRMATVAEDPEIQNWWVSVNVNFGFMVDTATGYPLSLEYAGGLDAVRECSSNACQRALQPGESHISSFYKRATFFTCGHPTPERLCEVCESDAVYRITTGVYTCEQRECDGVLKVKESVIREALTGKPGSKALVREYDTLK
jgi:hypothetical protein